MSKVLAPRSIQRRHGSRVDSACRHALVPLMVATHVLRRRPLTIAEILRWADAYRETTGGWPTRARGIIPGTVGETWVQVDEALRGGLRGLPGVSSLPRLLAEERGARNRAQLPPLTEDQILAWADAYHQQTGAWPMAKNGIIPDSGRESWSTIDKALWRGTRGLPGGSSLARFLAERRGVRNPKDLPPLTAEQVLAWADAHQRRTGDWPDCRSGPVPEAPGETWTAVDAALHRGSRGLPAGCSLALLLAEKRGVRNVWSRPVLSVEQVLAWADAHHGRTGQWPNEHSGPVVEAPEETWQGVNQALLDGLRGLPGGFSLAELLGVERGVRNRRTLPRLNRKQILAWATAHFRRTGTWPSQQSGAVADAPDETWQGVDKALRHRRRGLRDGSSLAQLLAQHGKKRNPQGAPPLSRKKILAWADAHYRRLGEWPGVHSGPVADAPGESWKAIDQALRQGRRGLTGGSSVARLLAKKRGVAKYERRPPLTEEKVRRWAELHFQRTGVWPQCRSGPIADVPGESWRGVDVALRVGTRGLPGGSTLARLLREQRSLPAASPQG
jgi:hypothetical protein